MANSIIQTTQIQDVVLIKKAQNGDKRAKERLIESYYGYLRKISSRFKVPGFDSDDLHQEALLAFSVAVDRFDESKNIKFNTFVIHYVNGYLGHALRSVTGYSNKLKSDKSKQNYKNRVAITSPEYCDFLENAPRSNDEQRVFQSLDIGLIAKDLLDTLPEKDRNVLTSHLKGETYKDIAVACDTNAPAIKRRLDKIKNQLRETYISWD